MTRPSELRIRCFPASDNTFATDVRAALAAGAGDVSEDDLRRAVLAHLRRRHQRVTIVRQDDLARLDPREHTWYVYRDGRALANDDPAGPVPGAATQRPLRDPALVEE